MLIRPLVVLLICLGQALENLKIFVSGGTDNIKGGTDDDIITISSSGKGDADTIDGHTHGGSGDTLALSTGTHTFNDNNKLKILKYYHAFFWINCCSYRSE